MSPLVCVCDGLYWCGHLCRWGLTVYEQDWLDIAFNFMDALHSDINLGREWLLQMGRAADKNGISIQYCMSMP